MLCVNVKILLIGSTGDVIRLLVVQLFDLKRDDLFRLNQREIFLYVYKLFYFHMFHRIFMGKYDICIVSNIKMKVICDFLAARSTFSH